MELTTPRLTHEHMIQMDELEWIQVNRVKAIDKLDRGGDYIEKIVRELFAQHQRKSSTHDPVKLPLLQIISHVRLKWRHERQINVASGRVSSIPTSSHIGVVLARVCIFENHLLTLNQSQRVVT